MKKRKTRENLPLFILGFVIVCLSIGIITKQQFIFASALNYSDDEVQDESGDHFITIYDDNEKITVRSAASTVREILERADITYSDEDIVEPELDENIDGEDFNINIYRARDVLIVDGLTRKIIKTAATAPEDVAEAAGVELQDEDIVKMDINNNILESGVNIVYEVKRAKTVNLQYYGKAITLRTQAETVADFLAEQNISRDNEQNWISLDDSVEISDGISLIVAYQGKQTITVDEKIAYKTKTSYDYSLEYGKEETIKEGTNGTKAVTYEIEMKNGVEVSRTKISEIITKKAIDKQVKVGMKVSLPSGTHADWMAAAGIDSSDYGYVNYIVKHESGWRPYAISSNGYYGLYQTSKSTLVKACGENWASDPVCQLRSASKYAKRRYGSWQGAYNFWTSNHWW